MGRVQFEWPLDALVCASLIALDGVAPRRDWCQLCQLRLSGVHASSGSRTERVLVEANLPKVP